MEIKSNKQTDSKILIIILSILDIFRENMLIIIIGAISSILIHYLTTMPPVIKTDYDCSKLTETERKSLSETTNTRLQLISEAMNSSLRAGSHEREDMQQTIEQIMEDTRKEFCKPMKEI